MHRRVQQKKSLSHIRKEDWFYYSNVITCCGVLNDIIFFVSTAGQWIVADTLIDRFCLPQS